MTRVSLSWPSSRVASASSDETVRLWFVQDDGQRVLRGHRADVEELAWASSGDFLVSGAEDDTARIWFMDGRPSRAMTNWNEPP